MALITSDIQTILRKRAQDLAKAGIVANLDVTTVEGVRNVARAEFFSVDHSINGTYRPEIQAIDEDFREFFCTAFPLHYFYDEIGMDTLPAWKVALTAKIYENAEYMNSIFDHLDKQAMKSYHIRKVDNTAIKAASSALIEGSDTQVNSAHEGSDTRSSLATSDATANKSGSATTSGEDNGTSTKAASGNDSQHSEKTGGSSGSGSKLHNDVDSASKTVNASDLEAASQSGTSTNANVTSGSYTDTDSRNTNKASSSNAKANSVAGTLDTPQGSLQNLRGTNTTPPVNFDPTGMGVSAAYNAQFNYLSAAATSDATNTADATETGADTAVHVHNGNGYSVSDTGATTGASNRQKTADSAESSAANRMGYEEYNDSTETGETLDAANNSASVENGSSHNASTSASNSAEASNASNRAANSEAGTNASSDNSHTENSRESQSSSNENLTGSVDEDDKVYSMELLMAAEPFMKKIWDIFDPIFMQIIDAF